MRPGLSRTAGPELFFSNRDWYMTDERDIQDDPVKLADRRGDKDAPPTPPVRPGQGSRLREWLLGFHGSPRQVARGLAIGILIGLTPPLGLQMVAAVAIATLLHANRAAAVAAVWITNPFTALPIYASTYRVGLLFVPHYRPVSIRKRLTAVIVDEDGEWLNLAQQFKELTSLGAEVLVPMSLGGLFVGLLLASVVYLLTLAVFALIHTGRGKIA